MDVNSYFKKIGIKLCDTIGEGSYCKVKIALCYDINEQKCAHKIACKIINIQRASYDFINKFLPRELEIMCSINHPNIVRIFHAKQIKEKVYIFMDLCEKGDLLEYINIKGPLKEQKAKYYFKQIVNAVKYLHSKDIAHRDLKCENILLTSSNILKIGDFGFARMCSDPVTNLRILSKTFCGSAAYAAPEVLRGIAYNPKMYDMWSLGCVLFIILTASMPFFGEDTELMLYLQINRLVKLPKKINNTITLSCKQILINLLEPDVTKRANINQVASSTWLKEN